jgi:hypothetical protein
MRYLLLIVAVLIIGCAADTTTNAPVQNSEDDAGWPVVVYGYVYNAITEEPLGTACVEWNCPEYPWHDSDITDENGYYIVTGGDYSGYLMEGHASWGEGYEGVEIPLAGPSPIRYDFYITMP